MRWFKVLDVAAQVLTNKWAHVALQLEHPQNDNNKQLTDSRQQQLAEKGWKSRERKKPENWTAGRVELLLERAE